MHSPVEAFPGDGEMAARMRAFDWPASPLGAPDTWDPGLRSAVEICLTSRFPMIVWWGPELRFFYNDAYRSLLGSKHPALGKPGSEVWGEIWHIIGPMLEGVLETGEATWSDDMLLPIARHGYREETYWTYSYSPLRAGDRIGGVFTAVTETTQRVVGERRLAALRDLGAQVGAASSIAEACDLAVAAIARAAADVAGAVVYLRGEHVFPAASTAGMGGQPTGIAGWPVEAVLRTGEPLVLGDLPERFGGPLPGGTWERPPTEAMVLPLRGETGAAPLGAIVLAASSGRALDQPYRTFLALVADQVAAALNAAAAYESQARRVTELAELDRAKTAFFSNISHEFRTPLTLIMGPLEEVRAALPPATDDALRESLDAMHRNGLRLGKLVNTLLDFSRLQAGRIEADYEPVDLGAVTADLASVFRSAVESAGLTFTVDCAALSRPVHVDREMWEKVVLNLLSNALKFTFDGGITVAVAEQDDRAVVRVTDTGTGIPADEVPRLFERFHRVQGTRSRSYEGSGIGLALVQELVALHGGTVEVDSRVDVGTTFTVRLPFGAGHLPEEKTRRARPEAPPPVQGVRAESALPYITEWQPPEANPPQVAGHARVLVADDNADMRDYLQRLLSPHYNVLLAGDGKAALDLARTATPDLIVSDVMMPLLDGLALVAELRADPRTARVPVVLLSARARAEDSGEGLAAGADDYLVKPFSARDLLDRVRANLMLARLRNHHADWRDALVNSLQDAFFVLDTDGTLVEANDAFGRMLGYPVDGAPYPMPHPWWPEPDSEDRPDVDDAVRHVMTESRGRIPVPLRHADGRRVWVDVTSTWVFDPDRQQRVMVGTLRDITGERLAGEREAALARLTAKLSEADTVADVVAGGLVELRAAWRARRAVAATWHGNDEPTVVGTAPRTTWDGLDQASRGVLAGLRLGRSLQVVTPEPTAAGAGIGISLEYADGRVAFWLECAPERTFGAEDRALLALLGGYLGQAINRAHRADQQRAVALTLQRSFLGPTDLPDGFAVRYEPAVRPLEVGGDWYDVVALPDGRIALVVGDCVGSGLPAATAMGQLRSACRALLLQSAGPAQTLTALDRFAALVPDAFCSTLLCGVLDPRDGTLRYSSAGHPPGIVVHQDGTAAPMDGARSVPLAAAPGIERPEATVTLTPGALLLLYTDGLAERRGEAMSQGIAAVSAALVGHRLAPIDPLVDAIMEEFRPAQGYFDDVAVLAYRRLGQDATRLAHSFGSTPAELAPVRQALRSWTERLGLGRQVSSNLLIAVGEACANAIEHAHRFDARRSLLSGWCDGDDVHVVITDSGRWRPSGSNPDPDRGHGLRLIRGLVPGSTIDSTQAGTTVRLRVRIDDD
ncbi:histidine kinase [Virgisporangium aliadipatigenens]|uniref:histidine kinase n=1 Tax=Virgisporangium aliadipatigenens TaxID=741659 RepID=A0A8J4DRN2_9ACTN|nr:SpoIIE family protein phosphatase [Virgisporangium aliadipatigenens]GIJ46497.1 histidine kinase [Virgisporangium aliadipatigenens]